jgi:hypothetical protein
MKESTPENSEPLNAYLDERGDDDWDERDLAKLKGGDQRPEAERNQAKTSGQPKDSEK